MDEHNEEVDAVTGMTKAERLAWRRGQMEMGQKVREAEMQRDALNQKMSVLQTELNHARSALELAFKDRAVMIAVRGLLESGLSHVALSTITSHIGDRDA